MKKYYQFIILPALILLFTYDAFAYEVQYHWLSDEPLEIEVTDFTDSDVVYCNVIYSGSIAGSDVELRWFNPAGEREFNLGTPFTKVFGPNQFYGGMLIKEIYREPGQWSVEHWADVYLPGIGWGWHKFFTEFFNIPPQAYLTISPPALVNFSPTDSFDSPAWGPKGLAFDGTYLWCYTHGTPMETAKIFKLTTSGSVIKFISSPHPNCEGLTFDGTYLWTSDYYHEKIYKIDTAGNIISIIDFPVYGGLAYDGMYLWCVGPGSLVGKLFQQFYKLDTSGNIIESFTAPGGGTAISYFGLGYDGTYLWSCVRSALMQFEKLYQMDTSGNLINSFDSPGLQPYGLTFGDRHLWHSDSFTYGKIYMSEYRFYAAIGFSMSKTFKVSSSGTLNLVIGNASITGPDASEYNLENDNCSGETLIPSESCELSVAFSPVSEGNKSATLEISSNDFLSPQQIQLPGKGVANICKCDFEPDGDVDGCDLATHAKGNTGITLEIFSTEFGKIDCL